jgi:hypothetical protein
MQKRIAGSFKEICTKIPFLLGNVGRLSVHLPSEKREIILRF